MILPALHSELYSLWRRSQRVPETSPKFMGSEPAKHRVFPMNEAAFLGLGHGRDRLGFVGNELFRRVESDHE